MRNHWKLVTTSLVVFLTFASPQAIQAAEDINDQAKRDRDPASMLPSENPAPATRAATTHNLEEYALTLGGQEKLNPEGKRDRDEDIGDQADPLAMNLAPLKRQTPSSPSSEKNETVSDQELLGWIIDLEKDKDLREKVNHYVKKHTVEILKELHRKNSEEHALTFYIGGCFALSIGCENNLANKQEALVWFRKAAEGGHVFAMAHLAANLGNAIGCENNLANKQETLVWLRKLAESGHLSAMYQLATKLESAIGCEDNLANKQEALVWYRKAAEGGNFTAMNGLAVLMGKAIGCEDNFANKQEALVWFRKAAEGGNINAMAHLATNLVNAIGCEDNLANKQEALVWFRKAAEGGNLIAMNNLAYKLAHAIGCEDNLANKEEALVWFRKAAEGGNFTAMAHLAHKLVNAIGCEDNLANKQEALVWFRKAAESGNLSAMVHLARNLVSAIGCEDNLGNKQEGYAWKLRFCLANKFKGIEGGLSFQDFLRISDDMIKQNAKTVAQTGLEDTGLGDDGYMGFGKGLNLLGQLAEFSALMEQELKPESEFHKDLSLTPDLGRSKTWDNLNRFYVPLQSTLRWICENTLCFIPTSKEALEHIKEGGAWPAMEASTENLESLETTFPIRFYSINGLYYLTIGDKNVAVCNQFLQLLLTLPDQDYDEETMHSIREINEIKFKLGLNQKMKPDPDFGITIEDIAKKRRNLQYKQKIIEETCPEVRFLKDSHGIPTEYRFFEAARVIQEYINDCIVHSRPYKVQATINNPDLGPFQYYVRK